MAKENSQLGHSSEHINGGKNMFFNFKKYTTKKSMNFLVVGLGNPTEKYNNTRHNAGFMAIDYIAKTLNVDFNKSKFNSLFKDVNLDDKRILLVKPQTYMNLSGEAVSKFVSFYKIPLENVIVFSDDISLPVGKIRIRRKGSHGGHNGLKNIISMLGNDNFPRVKIGVGSKPDEWELSDWVLSKFSESELNNINMAIKNSLSALKLIINDKMDDAMSKFN